MDNNNQNQPPTSQNNPTSVEQPQTDPNLPNGVHFTNSTILAALSYLGPLIVIPFIAGKDDPFVNFHLKQGLVVFLITAVLWLIFNFFLLFWLHQIIQILEFGILILIIIGIINALQKKEKDLPLVGKYAHQIKF